MHRKLTLTLIYSTFWAFLTGLSAVVTAADKLPPEKAGTIGKPEGKIAFIRDKNIWYMNADGTNQTMVTEVTNADGRLTWATDNKRIMFTRKGTFDIQAPDMMGGHHKIYDLFIAYLDSAANGNTMFWRRVTDDLGSRDPDWLPESDLVVFTKDVNAIYASSSMPKYAICTMKADGTNTQILRKNFLDAEYEVDSKKFITSPSMNTKGDLAIVYFENLQPLGMAVIPSQSINISLDSIRILADKNRKGFSPAWSPDGQWLAYVINDINSNALYITTPDQKENYLVFQPPVGTYIYTIAPSFSPDSKWLTFATTDGSIWIVDITGNNAKRLSGPGLDKSPAWSKAEKK